MQILDLHGIDCCEDNDQMCVVVVLRCMLRLIVEAIETRRWSKLDDKISLGEVPVGERRSRWSNTRMASKPLPQDPGI